MVVVAVLVVAADALFYGHVVGCSAGLFALLLSIAVMAFGRGVTGRRGVAATAVLLSGLLVALVLEPGALALGMTVLGLVVLVLFQRHGGSGDAILWFRRVRSLLLRGVWQWARDLQRVVRIPSDAPGTASKGAGLRRWLPAFGLGVVFLSLFALANPVLAGWLEAVADRASYLGAFLEPQRVVFWIVVALFAWGALRTRSARVKGACASDRSSPVSEGTLARSLWIFNALFLLQNALDVRHLVLGVELPDGLTYAEYARGGAWPLMAAALLSASFILTAFRGAEDQFGPGVRRFVYAFLAQNVALTGFGMLRLANYVDAYGLSRWRLAAFLWMGLVAVGIVLIVARIVTRRSNRWLIGANALAGVALLYACCFPNGDRFIADHNVSRCREMRGHGSAIDLDYLKALGTDALPACRRLQREASDRAVRERAGRLADAARARLDRQLENWRGWTLRRAALRDDDRDAGPGVK